MNQEKKNKFFNCLFYICYTLILLCNMFQNVNNTGKYLYIMYKIALFILAMCTIVNILKIPKKSMLISLITLIVALLIYILFDNEMVLLIVLFSISYRNIDIKKIVKYDLLVKIPALLIICALYFAGHTTINNHIRNGIIRQSMGFANPNTFSAYITSIGIELLFLSKKKLSLKNIAITIFLVFLINYYADSRTQIIGMAIIFILFFINERKKNIFNNKISKFICKNMFIIMTIVSLIAINMYSNGNKLAINFDKSTYGRLSIPSTVLRRQKIQLFGNKINEIREIDYSKNKLTTYQIDNMYLYLLLYLGIIPYLMICYCIKKLVVLLIDSNQTYILCICLLYMIIGMTEKVGIHIQYNLFLISFSNLIFSTEIIKKRSISYEVSKYNSSSLQQ